MIVRGSLAPDGGIVKLGLRTDKILKFTGKARCFGVRRRRRSKR